MVTRTNHALHACIHTDILDPTFEEERRHSGRMASTWHGKGNEYTQPDRPHMVSRTSRERERWNKHTRQRERTLRVVDLTFLNMMENNTPPMVMHTMNDENISPVGRTSSRRTPCRVGTHMNTARGRGRGVGRREGGGTA